MFPNGQDQKVSLENTDPLIYTIHPFFSDVGRLARHLEMAYGFAGGAEARSLFAKAVRDDPNHRVQEFASQALTMDSWWQA